jgi:hypothetical protein
MNDYVLQHIIVPFIRVPLDHSWSPALSHQQSAQLHAFLCVEIQQSCCRATFRSHPLYAPIFSQLKMGMPALLARMKQGHNAVGTPGFRVCGSDVGPFFQVTAQATEAEIALLIGPQVLLGDNMIDLMR